MLTNDQRRWLDYKTRHVPFLWRMSLGILAAGLLVGAVVDWAVDDRATPPEQAAVLDPEGPQPEPEQFRHYQRLHDHAKQGRWWEVCWAIPAGMLSRWQYVGISTLAVLTGLCWFMFILQACEASENRRLRLSVAVLGIPLGVLSIWLTHFLLLYQEYRWELVDSQELVPGLRFFILGVGFREELSKLVFFLPLLPWIVRRRDAMAALLAGGCVGLGFAIEENLSYIGGSGGVGTLSRLLMPAPFHMASGALLALAAYRACRWPKEWVPQLLVVFGGLVMLHGLYDAFISLPLFGEYGGILTMIAFYALMWQFFRELNELRTGRRQPISLTANFLACVSLVAAATFVYLAAAGGWTMAFDVMFRMILGQVFLVYLFLREMPESLVGV